MNKTKYILYTTDIANASRNESIALLSVIIICGVIVLFLTGGSFPTKFIYLSIIAFVIFLIRLHMYFSERKVPRRKTLEVDKNGITLFPDEKHVHKVLWENIQSVTFCGKRAMDRVKDRLTGHRNRYHYIYKR